MKKVLGILGGMGPQATIDFQQKVLNLTAAASDQEHMRVFVDSHPQIPPRTDAIFGRGENSAPAMQESLDKLCQMGAGCIAMPCITAHYFLPQLKVPSGITFLNAPQLTAKACLEKFPGKTVGTLSTSGTARSHTLIGVLESNGISYIQPNGEQQEALDALIAAVKAKGDMGVITAGFDAITAEMAARGAQYFILGCTELPLIVQAYAFPHAFVDPTTELAREAVGTCGYAML